MGNRRAIFVLERVTYACKQVALFDFQTKKRGGRGVRAIDTVYHGQSHSRNFRNGRKMVVFTYI